MSAQAKKAAAGTRARRRCAASACALAATVLATLAAGPAERSGQVQSPAGDKLVCPVRRGDFVQSVRALGKLRAEKTTNVTSELSGHFITDIVAEGTPVKEGDVMVELDASSIEERILDARTEITSAVAAARRTELDVDASIEELTARAAVAEARLALEEARPLPERRRAAQAKLNTAQAQADYAEYWLKAMRELHGDGVVSLFDVRGAELSHHSATIDLRQARKEFDEEMSKQKNRSKSCNYIYSNTHNTD